MNKIQKHLLKHGVLVAKYPSHPFESFEIIGYVVDALFKNAEQITIVQIGANDGLSGEDPLHKIITDKADRINVIYVEPQLDVFQRLKLNVPETRGRHFLNCAIGNKNGSLKLYRNVGGDGTITSFNKANVQKQAGATVEIEEIVVPIKTLHTALSEINVSELDILVIDVEGMELDVFSTIDFEMYKPKIIQFEHGHLNKLHLAEIFLMLSNQGYKIDYGGKQRMDSLAILI
jgi:FkbM family methyltransferase